MKIMRAEEVIANGYPPGPWKTELTPEELKEAYALARAALTPEDLDFTGLEEGIPVEEVLADMDNAQKEFEQKKQ